MRSFERRLISCCGAALLAALSVPALATGAEEDAKTLFARGRELRSAGRCEEAVIAFRRALEIYPEGLGALRNIAECEEILGRYASARRDWWDLRRAALQSNEARYDGWSDDAESRYRALGDKVGTLTIHLRGGEARGEVRVLLDGRPIDPRLLGVELERDLGLHTIELHYGGVAPVTERVTLAAGDRRVVTLTVPSVAAPQPPERGAPSAAPEEASLQGARTAGYVALGVGGAGVIATVVALVLRESAMSTIEEGCVREGGGYRCPPELKGDYDTGSTAATLVNVFAGVGLGGLGAGITLLALSPSKATPSAAGKAKAAELSLGGPGARLTIKF